MTSFHAQKLKKYTSALENTAYIV